MKFHWILKFFPTVFLDVIEWINDECAECVWCVLLRLNIRDWFTRSHPSKGENRTRNGTEIARVNRLLQGNKNCITPVGNTVKSCPHQQPIRSFHSAKHITKKYTKFANVKWLYFIKLTIFVTNCNFIEFRIRVQQIAYIIVFLRPYLKGN
jgi:hypothetical protein